MLDFLSRRDFLKITATSAVGAYFTALFPKLASAFSADIKYVRQIITEDSTISRTIMWQSSKPHPEAVLHYRTNANDDFAVLPKITVLHDNDETIYIYVVKLTALTPNTRYEYKINISNASTQWYQLTTPERNATFKAAIFPDSQCSDGYVTWRNVVHTAMAKHPDTSFMISMGDLVDNGEAAWQWRQWQDGIDDVWKAVPFAPVMGNHECYNLQWLCRLPYAYLNYFSLPSNGSTHFNRYYYSYDYGPVHFIVLNTQWDEINSFKQGLIDEQLAWLENDLQTADKSKWTVVLMHKDVIFYDDPQNLRELAYPKGKYPTTNPDENWQELPETATLADIDEVGKIFMPYFDKFNVDVVLTAHQHTYRRHGHIYNFQPSDRGPVYFCTGIAGNVRYNVGATHRFDRIILAQPETDNYMTLEASTDELCFTCYDMDNNTLDVYKMQK